MKTVGIIGNKGKFGLFLESLFIDYGCTVIGSDTKDGPGVDERNQDVVTRANIVVFSLPPRETVQVINSLIYYSRPDQLWMDVTSIKADPIEAMLKSRSAVVGLHPMCAPSVKTLRGQTLVVCPIRLYAWYDWLGNFLSWTKAKIKLCSPEKHDQAMAVVQGLTHAMQLVEAATIRSLGLDVGESMSFTSPVYRIELSLAGRILKQDPALYADIQMLNPAVLPVLRQAAVELNRLIEIVSEKNREEFESQFSLSREHFGDGELNNAFNLFEELSQLLADRGSEHQITLMVHEDKPGLLHMITGFFAETGVNLTHIHSFRTVDGHRFLLGFDRPKKSDMVELAVERMVGCGLVKVLDS